MIVTTNSGHGRQRCDPPADRGSPRRTEQRVKGHPPLEGCFSPAPSRGRNAVERPFCRLKDHRRIAIRYDKPADDFLSAVYIVASATCWL